MGFVYDDQIPVRRLKFGLQILVSGQLKLWRPVPPHLLFSSIVGACDTAPYE